MTALWRTASCACGCGEAFQTNHPKRLYLNREHRESAYRRERPAVRLNEERWGKIADAILDMVWAQFPAPAVEPAPITGLYVLHATASHLFKVGQSWDVRRRLVQHTRAIPETLELVGVLPIEGRALNDAESRLCEALAEDLAHDREWFHVTPHSTATIKATLDGGGQPSVAPPFRTEALPLGVLPDGDELVHFWLTREDAKVFYRLCKRLVG